MIINLFPPEQFSEQSLSEQLRDDSIARRAFALSGVGTLRTWAARLQHARFWPRPAKDDCPQTLAGDVIRTSNSKNAQVAAGNRATAVPTGQVFHTR